MDIHDEKEGELALIDFYQIRSPLSQTTEEHMGNYIRLLEEKLGESFRRVDLEQYLQDEFALLYVASGGSEGFFLEIFERLKVRHCYILTSGESNSLAASMEILIKEREGSRILSKIKPDAYVCTLEIGGKKMTSEGFSKFMEQAAITGKGHIIFVIGGSLGLSEAVMNRSNQAISFSDMTFPHQLMRVILCEQIYRGFRISHGEPYHK